ncbi:MAG: hypothetical protein C0601_09020 [Candidatus Muiribacterium halophilum]|uniref:DNA replication and repair protein RecF n=1 Tax=Muiribacterium halophilum TaxID=2053465 RepID=A0A2N5ZDW8_MUIH1|nr:MAG: hypothetical protein C0601_09020 [Candidatus Muirbacterium halophilum]
MIIKSINIKNFRNIEEASLNFSEDFNVMTGDNGQGKTNLLEALYFSGMMKSFRTRTLGDLFKDFKSKNVMFIEALYDYKTSKKNIRIGIEGRKKEVTVDGVDKKFHDLLSLHSFVVFIPDDLKIVGKEPVYRRKFINEICSQLYPGYYSTLLKYRKIVDNRNSLLKHGKEAGIWDEIFCESANYIIEKRLLVLEHLKEIFPKIYQEIVPEGEKKTDFSYKGKKRIDIEVLKECRNREIRKGHTVVGPHRDDIEILIGDYKARKAASRGQQRTIVFTLKMTQAHVISKIKNNNPVLILDDVFSELDEHRKKSFLISINKKFQVFISVNSFSRDILSEQNYKEFFVKEGKIVSKEI